MGLNSCLRGNTVRDDFALGLPNFLLLTYVPHDKVHVLLGADGSRECLIGRLLEDLLLPKGDRV